jgi:hypothetical protein
VVINERADAADYRHEFVELYHDAGPAGPDTTAPAPIADLAAVPLGADAIRLTWSASGDDGASGRAATYDLRGSTRRIASATDFASATPLAGAPVPAAAGSAESFVAGGLAADTAHYFAIVVRDESGNAAAPSNDAWAVTGMPGGIAPADHLVISQVRVAGTTDDAIEIYNSTAQAIPLAGRSLQYLAANGNFGFRVNLDPSKSVPARGWYLVAGNGYAGSPGKDDTLGASNLSASAGHALLVGSSANVTGCADAAIIDRVGYGAAATCPEGGAGHHATTPGAGASIARKPGGTLGSGQDTNVNDADFTAPAPAVFRNAASPPATPPAVLGNVRATLYLRALGGGAELRWGAAAAAVGYRVYRGTAADFMSARPVPWATAADTSVVDADVPAACLFYQVRATDGTVESED